MVGIEHDITGKETTVLEPGEKYTGPVAGVKDQYIAQTPDTIDLTVEASPGEFVKTGAGTDTIKFLDASYLQGLPSVADGGEGSSQIFVSKYPTNPTDVFIDARNLTASDPAVWTTVHNAHAGTVVTNDLTPGIITPDSLKPGTVISGDKVTVWGLTANDFQLPFIAGNEGATGLTYVGKQEGKPPVAFTLAGVTNPSHVIVTSGAVPDHANPLSQNPFTTFTLT